MTPLWSLGVVTKRASMKKLKIQVVLWMCVDSSLLVESKKKETVIYTHKTLLCESRVCRSRVAAEYLDFCPPSFHGDGGRPPNTETPSD